MTETVMPGRPPSESIGCVSVDAAAANASEALGGGVGGGLERKVGDCAAVSNAPDDPLDSSGADGGAEEGGRGAAPPAAAGAAAPAL